MKKVIVVDDHPLLREGLEALISHEDGLTCCGSGGSVEEALELVERTNPGLVLSDLNLSGSNGIELIKELRVRRPEVPVLIVSIHDELIYAERVLRAGGRGYIAKEAGGKVILDGIHAVLNGGVCVSKAVSDSFHQRFGNTSSMLTSVGCLQLQS